MRFHALLPLLGACATALPLLPLPRPEPAAVEVVIPAAPRARQPLDVPCPVVVLVTAGPGGLSEAVLSACPTGTTLDSAESLTNLWEPEPEAAAVVVCACG